MVPVNLFDLVKETDMNKKLKMIGKGFVYGMKHPYLDEPMKRTKDMSTIDGLLGDIGMSISQSTIQTVVGYGTAIIILAGLGYIYSKTNKADIKVKMVVDEDK